MEENKNVEKKFFNKDNFTFWVISFFTYCLIGWLYEVIWEAAIGNGFVNRGFLYGPYLPIYGFGMLVLLFLLRKMIKNKVKIGKVPVTPVAIFISVLFIASIIEYSASFIMELIFHKRWWDYSYDLININGRVSLRNSSCLALGATCLIYIVYPLLQKFVPKISQKAQKVISTVLLITISVDFVITILGYIVK